MCGVLEAVSLVGLAVGTGTQVYGQMEAADAQNAANEAQYKANLKNAEILERNAAGMELDVASSKEALADALKVTGRQAAQFKSSQVANTASSGVDVGTGSSADALLSTDTVANEDAMTNRKNIARQIRKIKQEQYNTREQASMLKDRQYAQIGSGLQVGSTIATGAFQFSDNLIRYMNK